MDKAFVSGYKIIRQVGEGGMAVVYLAQHRDVPDHKVIMKELKDSNLAARFLKEASHLARLDHPRICPIFHFFTEENRTFILMKYVEGETLKETLDRRGALSISESLRITADMLDALNYAHKRKIYHRDIKPSNIMIDSEGNTMVIDFGIAKSEEDPDMTQEGSFCGTPHFAPPEQFYSSSTIDWALADIYALGVTLFLLVTGEYPFPGQNWMEIAESKRSTNPPKPSARNKTVPAQLDGLVLSALSRDPCKRFQSAADMLSALVEVQKEIPSSTEEDLEYTRTVISQTQSAVRPRRKFLWPALAAAALSLITLGGYFMYTLGYFPSSVDEDRKILAVLPFENLGAPDTRYFAEGITEEITSKLAGIKGLGVISRSSAMKYKGSDKTVQEIGAELGASFILTGSIRWNQSREMSEVRITPQLIRVSDDMYIWSNIYQEELTEIFTVQADIATSIINELNVILLAPERQALRAIPTANLSAYDFYLKGKESFNRSWSKEDIEHSIEMNQRAVGIDSMFALAYASLSRGHASMYWEFYDRSPERLTLARHAALRSLELQPLLAEGHLALGYYYYHGELDFALALDEFNLGLEQQSNNSELLNAQGAVHRREGKFEEALGDFMQASQLDPRSHLILFDIGLTFSMLRRYDEAGVFMKRAMEMAPDWPLPLIYRAWLSIFRTGDVAEASLILQQGPDTIDLTRSRYYWWLARIINPDFNKTLQTMTLGSDTVEFYLQCAQFNRLLERPELELAYADSARKFLERSMLDQPKEPRFLSHLGLAYAGLRQKERAITEASRAVELLQTSKEAFDALFLVLNLTEVLVIFGEHEAAIQQLEFMMSIPGFVSAPYLAQDPLWKPLHDYPKFQQLLQSN